MGESQGNSHGLLHKKWIFSVLQKLEHPLGIISARDNVKENVMVQVMILTYYFVDNLL